MRPSKIVILASGKGSTFEFLASKIKKESLPIEILSLCTDRKCEALTVAKKFNIPSAVISPTPGISKKYWDQRLLQYLKAAQPDLIVLLGFLRKLENAVLSYYSGRIINSHPSLLPKYGGKGMYGLNIHKKVIENGELETGVTVHWVDQNYDEGKIIAQKKVKVQKNEKAESLEKRVKDLEKEFVFEELIKVLK